MLRGGALLRPTIIGALWGRSCRYVSINASPFALSACYRHYQLSNSSVISRMGGVILGVIRHRPSKQQCHGIQQQHQHRQQQYQQYHHYRGAASVLHFELTPYSLLDYVLFTPVCTTYLDTMYSCKTGCFVVQSWRHCRPDSQDYIYICSPDYFTNSIINSILLIVV